MAVASLRVDGCASPWRTEGARCPLGRPGPQAGPQGRAPALGDTVSTARPFVAVACPSLFAFGGLPRVARLRVGHGPARCRHPPQGLLLSKENAPVKTTDAFFILYLW